MLVTVVVKKRQGFFSLKRFLNGRTHLSHIYISGFLLNLQKYGKKESRKDSTSQKPSVSKKKSRVGEEDASKKRRKQKKDPNAPKKAMSGYNFFLQNESEVSSCIVCCYSYLSFEESQ